MKTSFIVLLFLLLTAANWAQVNLDNTGTYSQNFNSLGSAGGPYAWSDNSTIPGWYFQMASTGTTTYTVSYGQTSSAKAYSFGASGDGDRALGGIAGSSTGSIAYGVKLRNTTAQTISSITISFSAELWRDASATQQTLYFGYKTSATDISSLTPSTTNGWTSVSDLDFSPVTAGSGPKDGNAVANRETFTNYTINVTIPSGEYILLRWWDAYDVGINNNGFAIDDITINWNFALPVELQLFTANALDNQVNLSWKTATEIENLKFELERKNLSIPESGFIKIAEILGAGNSNSVHEYGFIDRELPIGRYEYRLKQIDLSGNSHFLKSVFTTVAGVKKEGILRVYPNPARNNAMLLLENAPHDIDYWVTVYNIAGERCLSSIIKSSDVGILTERLDLSTLNSGVYFISVESLSSAKSRIVTKIQVQR